MPPKRLLALAGLTLVLAMTGAMAVAESGSPSADPANDPANALGSPEIYLQDPPETLELHQGGTVTVTVGAPAAPGDPVYLHTAGRFGAGWVRVAETVLGKDRTASLKIPAHEYLTEYEYWATVPATADHQEGNSDHFVVRVVAPPAQRDPICGGVTRLKGDGTPWVCTFSDEFDGARLDRRYWVPQKTEKSGFTTGTELRYACAYDDPSTIGVRDGNLELSLVDLGESRDCGKDKRSQYAFGQVMHHQTYAQTYGKYEVRARIPEIRVPGVQQSFWLWPEKLTYGPWPASGELDFAEMYSNDPDVMKPFMHYLPGAPEEDNPNSNNRSARCPIRHGEFNVYGMTWEPGRVTIRVNHRICMVNDYTSLVAGEGSPAPFDHPFFLALNQAMGAIGNEYVPGTLPERITTEIDYVRIWR